MNDDDPEIKDLEKQVKWLKKLLINLDGVDGDPNLLSCIDGNNELIQKRIDELDELRMQLLCD